MQIDPLFMNHIRYLDLDAIEESRDVTYIVDRNFILRAFNDAWTDFAVSSGGESLLAGYPIGGSIRRAITPDLERFYVNVYKTVFKTGQPLHHECECSSAEIFRILRQSVYPLIGNEGWVISNHFILESDHSEPSHEFSRRFVGENGLVVQCANCRKLRDARSGNTWLWVPAAVETPPDNVTYGTCQRCFDHYYYSMSDD